MEIKKSILYFSEPGEINTSATLKEAKLRADELGLKNIVVASTKGNTALKALDVFKGYNVVVVTHSTGLKKPGFQELNSEIAEEIKLKGGKILTGMHPFHNVSGAIQRKFQTVYPSGIIAQTLRLFGQGMKVSVEIVLAAADAGLIPADEDVVSIAGTGGAGGGADTAIIVKPANTHTLFELVIKEIIVKPNNILKKS